MLPDANSRPNVCLEQAERLLYMATEVNIYARIVVAFVVVPFAFTCFDAFVDLIARQKSSKLKDSFLFSLPNATDRQKMPLIIIITTKLTEA